jgi:hypothetical protein
MGHYFSWEEDEANKQGHRDERNHRSDCEHTIAGDGTNGNIGFYRTAPLPEGMKEHCKKTEQVNFPWIVIACCKDYPEMQTILDRYKEGKLSYSEADKQMNDFIVAKNKEEGRD